MIINLSWLNNYVFNVSEVKNPINEANDLFEKLFLFHISEADMYEYYFITTLHLRRQPIATDTSSLALLPQGI